MATLFTVTETMNHAGFQQPDDGGNGLPRPLGVAWLHRGYVASSSGDLSNDAEVRPQGVGAYVYTLQDVFVQFAWTGTASSAAQQAVVQSFAETLSAHYRHQPLYNDISNQELAGAGITDKIQFQQWGFQRTLNPRNFITDGTLGTLPIGYRVVLQPERNPNHAGNYPTTIPETWSSGKSPRIEINLGEIQTYIGDVGIAVAVSYLFWAPRDRLTAEAYAELPVRGT